MYLFPNQCSQDLSSIGASLVQRGTLSRTWLCEMERTSELFWYYCVAFVNRTITIESVPASSQVILNQQRLKRPSSPHFTIYQPQLTWVASIVNRMTGVGLSVGTRLVIPRFPLASFSPIDSELLSHRPLRVPDRLYRGSRRWPVVRLRRYR